MFLKSLTMLVWCFAVCAGVLLFWTSGEVQKAEEKQIILSRSLVKERERIHVLNAEWNYLNNPAYLEAMAERYLEGEKESTDKIILAGHELPIYSIPDIPPEKPHSYLSSVRGKLKTKQPAKFVQKTPVQLKKPREFNALLASLHVGR